MKDSEYRRNHYVPKWYQSRFIPEGERERKFHYLDLKPEPIDSNEIDKSRRNVLRWGPKKCFVEKDLYTTNRGSIDSTDIEQFFFGRVDRAGQKAVEFFSKFDHSRISEENFLALLNYMSVQKLRTPKGLGRLSELAKQSDSAYVLALLQDLQNLHCAIWTESIWQIADASQSPTKFIISDHPVTVYNRDCFPGSKWCRGYGDPEITLTGTHTFFPLSLDKILILTNLSWVRNPYQSAVRARPNPRLMRPALFNFTEIQIQRALSEQEVLEINYMTKKRALQYLAAGKRDWLFPERYLSKLHWRSFGGGYLLMPDPRPIAMTEKTVIGYKDGASESFSEYGHRPWQSDFHNKRRWEREFETLQAFKGEFAQLHGPKRRGLSFSNFRLDREIDTDEYHRYHLGLGGSQRSQKSRRRGRKN